MHSALYQGINSKFVFKITLSSSSILQCYLPVLLIRQALDSRLHAGAVALEDYNVCFIIFFNLPCTDIFLEN